MSVEVRSNIKGELAKIRRGVVYGDSTTVVDELVQNAKRAHATEVRFETLDDGFAIMDNGKGCADPQSLFEQHYSGWGDCDEAFGEGFFSVFAVADKVEARSDKWIASFDVNDMIESGNLEIPVEKARQIKGFRCYLHGGIAWSSYHAMLNRFKALAKLEQGIKFYVDGERVSGKKSCKGELGEWGMEFHNDLYDAYIRPAKASYHSPEIAYDSRPVDGESYFVEYAKGIVMVKKGGATPKAPDRKTFVWDGKRTALKESLKCDISTMYVHFLSHASTADLDGYDDAIERCVPVADYAYKLPMVDGILNGIVPDDSAEHDVAGMIAASRRVVTPDCNGSGAISVDNSERTLKKRDSGAQTLASYISQMQEAGVALVYGKSSNEEDRNLANSLAYDGVTVLWAPNNMYAKAFEELGVEHISNLFGKSIDIRFENDAPNGANEKIIESILNNMAKSMNVKVTFAFADIIEAASINGSKVNGRGIEGCCDFKSEMIYIDRRHFDVSGYALSLEMRTEGEWRCMMLLENVVCHELAHFIFGTEDNTLEHFQKTAELTREYARLV